MKDFDTKQPTPKELLINDLQGDGILGNPNDPLFETFNELLKALLYIRSLIYAAYGR